MRIIETRYAGCEFRSRLEARFAVFFDALNEPWEYEQEGFILNDGTRYLPDFWLPEMLCYFEIKGARPTEDEFQKAEGLAVVTQKPVAVVNGMPGMRWGRLYYDNELWSVHLGVDELDRLAFLVDGLRSDVILPLRTSRRWLSRTVDLASDRARSERFEGRERDILR